MAKTNGTIMMFTDFVKKYDDEIKELANEMIAENEERYFDGYTSFSNEDYSEAIEAHWDEFVYMYAEYIDVMIEDDRK